MGSVAAVVVRRTRLPSPNASGAPMWNGPAADIRQRHAELFCAHLKLAAQEELLYLAYKSDRTREESVSTLGRRNKGTPTTGSGAFS